MTTTKQINWRNIVIAADPDWPRNKRFVTEYEFTAAGRAGDDRTHEDGKRVFKGNYDIRGPYST